MPGAELEPGDAASDASGEPAVAADPPGLADGAALAAWDAPAGALGDATRLDAPGPPDAVGLADALMDGDGDGDSPVVSDGGAAAVRPARTSADTMPTIPPAR
jgi:hypothetical protein